MVIQMYIDTSYEYINPRERRHFFWRGGVRLLLQLGEQMPHLSRPLGVCPVLTL